MKKKSEERDRKIVRICTPIILITPIHQQSLSAKCPSTVFVARDSNTPEHQTYINFPVEPSGFAPQIVCLPPILYIYQQLSAKWPSTAFVTKMITTYPVFWLVLLCG